MNQNAPVYTEAASSGLTVNSPWLKASAAAGYCGISVRLLYAAARSGELRVALIGRGRSVRFRREWLDAWLESRATALPAA